MKQDHPKLSVRRQCKLLWRARSTLSYQLCDESAENLKFMKIIHCLAGAFEECCREGTSNS